MPVAPTDEQIASLRGAQVRPIDARKLREVVAGLCAAALLALSAAFFVAGSQHDATLSDLESHGVRVSVTVTGCTGQLGGSGSNAAGYSCRGWFTLHGTRYVSTLADGAAHAPGDQVVEVTPSDDPGHLTTVSSWRTDRASWVVFVLPTVLAVAGVAAAAALALSVRRRRAASG